MFFYYANCDELSYDEIVSHLAISEKTTQQWEAGLKNEFFDGHLKSTFSYFELTKQQGIGAPDPANPLRSKAIGEAKTRGIEVNVAG